MSDLNDQSPVPGGTTAIRGGKYVTEERAPGPPTPHQFVRGGGCMSRCRSCGKTFSDPVHGPQPENIRRIKEALMTDTERLAALLEELDPLAVSMDDLAARLVAAGVRVGDEDDWDREVAHHKAIAAIEAEATRIDPDRLARAFNAQEGTTPRTQHEYMAAIVKAYEEDAG